MIRTYGCLNAKDVWTNYDHYFPSWFKGHVMDTGVNDDVIHSLALGPSTRVWKFNRYFINGFHFHTFNFGKNKSTTNYGVCVKGVEGNDYFGVLEEIIEFVYIGAKNSYKTILFKCAWYDPGQGTRMHEKYKLVEVNHTRSYPTYDPFVLAYQVEQVYFAPSPTMRKERNPWFYVFNIKPRGTIDAPLDEMAFQEITTENPPLLSEDRQDDGDDDLHWDSLEYEILNEEEEEELEEEEEEEEEMTYRCRGGLNGRGPIIRGPRKVVETRDFTESDATENALENATTETEHATNQQSETHIRSDEQLSNGDLDRGITVSDDRCNPQAKLVLDPDKLW
ncbi:uncharacterized protein LOC125491578 [Beta vulgaris subsp. vulgaris]|uniref:uncharacterized protein LOC125491578 n=1 Tax=Beta vulgaris subsp. vulgaris TaxID=3555 RepID=UPI002548640A|nr:uncharacterized protein LOC125491578 [Beta vulgaris subsp. vulgaris]